MNFLRAELSIANVNFMRAELSFVNFMGAEHCECEFYESKALRIKTLCKLTILNVKYMRSECCEVNL